MSVRYSINRWNDLFETAQSRKVKGALPWVAVPTKHDGMGFKRIMAMPNAATIYAAWMLMLQVAAKCPVRGLLADETGPFDVMDLSARTGLPAADFEAAIKVLSDKKIGWIVVERYHCDGSPEPFSPATEHNSTEHNNTQQGIAASPPPVGDSTPPPAASSARYCPEDVHLPPELDTEVFRASLRDWFAQRRRKRISLREDYLLRTYETLRPLGPTVAAECLKYTVDKDYQAIFPERFSPNAKQSTHNTGTQPGTSGRGDL